MKEDARRGQPHARSAPSCWTRCAHAPPPASRSASAWWCLRASPRRAYVIYTRRCANRRRCESTSRCRWFRRRASTRPAKSATRTRSWPRWTRSAERRPDEIIISTHPVTHSGLAAARPDRAHPERHGAARRARRGRPRRRRACRSTVTLVIANKTSSGEELLERLKAKAAHGERHLFIAVVPQVDGSGQALAEARARLATMLSSLARRGPVGVGHDRRPRPVHGHHERAGAVQGR